MPDIVVFGIVITYKLEKFNRNIESLSELSNYFGSSFFGSNNGTDPEFKYLYSRKWGWIDMRHFSYAAYQASLIYNSANSVLNGGEGIEYDQEMGNFPHPFSKESAWNSEDLVSNLLGVAFYMYLNTSAAKGKNLLTNLNNFLKDCGFTDPSIKMENETKSPLEHLPGNYVLPLSKIEKNYTYDPCDAPDKDKRTTDSDKLALKLQESQEKDGKDRKNAVKNRRKAIIKQKGPKE